MARVKTNLSDNYESVIVKLSRESNPIAYQTKLEELVEQGCYNTIEEAEMDNEHIDIELEIYYDKHHGLFGVESGAIESCAESIQSPYTGEYMIDSEK